MRFIYSLLFYLSVPYIGLRLLWRSRRNPQYLKRWSERWGRIPFAIKPHGIWWHSVSMGETLASIPLIKLLQKKYPELPILVTTMTPTGSQQVIKNLGESVQHMYIPYDLPNIMSKFIKNIQPKLVVLMETELWPNMLYYCHQYKVPVLLANARLSEKSAKSYARFAGVTHEMLQNITYIAVQNKEDAARFVQLGFPTERQTITGTVKFDITISADLINKAKDFRASWGINKSVWIAASTHSGEEEIILNAAKKIPDALLILAPRHTDRAKEVLALCQQNNLKTSLRSLGELPDQNTDVFLVDTMGELLFFYAVADIAFVGGSFIPKGGHNLLEPAALGLPIITGKSLYNFAEIEKLLDKAQALIKVENADQLSTEINSLFQHKDKSHQMGDAAKQVVMENKGATEKHLLLIERALA
jgi:3-deoxy-D-manno-octulosonic-acid transferase